MSLYTDNDLLSLSALNHYLYCNRRFALIHIERLWSENRFTAEGRVIHEHVHEPGKQSRGEIRLESAVPLRSYRLGLVGVADLVEFHRIRSEGNVQWQPFPVEYKRGKPKKDNSDKVQLCAQALCLEEMLEIEVPVGALFYGRTKRRLDILFDRELRAITEDASLQLHHLIEAGKTPPPVYSAKCDNCSLHDLCLPGPVARKESVVSYFDKVLKLT